tara:strand:+ start:4865 stop:5875 length:1011 start_codon:yes stop_codon:yes gene_type:complete
MAFLDNSGDIILDAVLTDVGRKKMADGTFSVVKYALGDDEIDYGLYNKNHPSGTAYYDLEIMQTPVFEAFTGTNANINYGLMSLSRDDILYMPSLVMNESTVAAVADNIVYKKNGTVYLAMTATTTAASTEDKLATDLGNAKYFLTDASTSGRAVLLESGLDTSDVAPTSANRQTYLTNNNMLDTTFNVYYDTRFLGGVIGPSSGTSFSNDTSNGVVTLNKSLAAVGGTSATDFMENYAVASVSGIADSIFQYTGSPADSTVSALKGPRGTFTMLNFQTVGGLNDTTFSLYGSLNDTSRFAGSNQYNYLTTTVYIQGAISGITEQVDVTIIQYSGT